MKDVCDINAGVGKAGFASVYLSHRAAIVDPGKLSSGSTLYKTPAMSIYHQHNCIARMLNSFPGRRAKCHVVLFDSRQLM
jgi:hypothetical protein